MAVISASWPTLGPKPPGVFVSRHLIARPPDVRRTRKQIQEAHRMWDQKSFLKTEIACTQPYKQLTPPKHACDTWRSSWWYHLSCIPLTLVQRLDSKIQSEMQFIILWYWMEWQWTSDWCGSIAPLWKLFLSESFIFSDPHYTHLVPVQFLRCSFAGHPIAGGVPWPWWGGDNQVNSHLHHVRLWDVMWCDHLGHQRWRPSRHRPCAGVQSLPPPHQGGLLLC